MPGAVASGPRPGPSGRRLSGRRSSALGHLENLVGDQPVRLAVHVGSRLGSRSLDQAEDLACAFVHPVIPVVNAMGHLHRQIGLVRVGAVDGGGDAALATQGRELATLDIVDVHVEMHQGSP